MFIYLINFALIIFWGNFLKDKRISSVMILTQMFLLLALGDISLGVDSGVYSEGYKYIARLDFADMLSRLHLVHSADLRYPFAFESGYVFLNWVIAHMGIDFKGFLIIISAFMMFSIGKFVMKYAEKPWISLLLYVSLGFFTYDFGILRQAMALHILLFAFPAIIERDFKKFLLYVFIACLMHRTAIVFIPIYFFGNKKFNKNTILVSFWVDIVLIVFMPILLERIVYPFFSYIGKGTAVTQLVFSLNNLIILLMLIMVILFVFIDLKKCQSDVWRGILWAFTFSVFIEIAGSYNESIGRIIHYYYIYVILLIPKAIQSYRERNTRLLVSFVLIFLLLGFYMYSLIDSTIVPYKVFF